MIKLIVNADDFGHGPEVNAGVIEAHERGILTSTSLTVRRTGAREAADYARGAACLSVGLHLDLEWRPGGRVPDDLVTDEAERQLELYLELVGSEPTHVDSHHHLHTDAPLREAALGIGARLGVPVRHFDRRVRFEGAFFARDDEGKPAPALVTAEALAALVSRLPDGTTELCCHPARGVPAGTSYAVERGLELDALCDPAVRNAIAAAGVQLISFRELSG